MVIYLDDYRKAKAKKPAGARYNEAPPCANCNLVASAFALSRHQNEREWSLQLPADLASLDATGFLNRVHALASQI
ncbi:MAG TPA: hypothetical protein VNK67_06615 [Burkholderiales bacterium]|nr:hypothetical protein [Burkholderiales bacterium]